MKLNIVMPVAPRDIGVSYTALHSIEDAIRYLTGTNISELVNKIDVYYVSDGIIDSLDEERVVTEIRDFVTRSNVGISTEVVLLELKVPAGAGNARNAALALCHDSDLVCFMDADDMMYPWSLNLRLDCWAAAMQQMTEPTPVFVYGQPVIEFFDGKKGTTMRNLREVPDEEHLHHYIKQSNVLLTTTVLAPVGILTACGGFEPNLICGEDGNLWRRICETNAKTVPVMYPIVTYTYRMNSQSKLASSDPEGDCMFNDKAFHLQVRGEHGPMGQGLDNLARTRSQDVQKAEGKYPRLDALCGSEVQIHRNVSFGESHDEKSADNP